MSRFAPVFLDDEHKLDGRVSQTMLRHFMGCPRSGFFYAAYKGESHTAEMARGSAFHEFAERAVRLMLEQDEPMLPPELAKVIVGEVLAEYPVPLWEHDYLREMAYRWATQWTVGKVLAVEKLIVLEIGGWQVRCKVDYAEDRDGVLYVADFKTAKGAPSYEEISRKRSDGTVSTKNAQLILYALAMVYGLPVTEHQDVCATCEGSGIRFKATSRDEFGNVDGDEYPCEDCGERGTIRREVLDPFPIAAQAQDVIAEFVYPGIETSDGLMLRRTMGLTRLELEEYRESLEAVLGRLSAAESSGDWPAVVSDSACGECPARALCPIPAELRDHRGTINTMAELEEACEVYYREGDERNQKRKEIKKTAEALGGRVRFGADKVWDFSKVVEKTEIRDREGMFAAMERAVQFGEPFDRSQFVRMVVSTPFAERTLSEQELEEETAEQEERCES